MGNLLVDEARLSENRYQVTNDETEALLMNHDLHVVTVPAMHAHSVHKHNSHDYRTELYLF